MTARRFGLLLLLLLMPALACAANVQASLDRDSVQLGETATLSLRIDGDAGNVEMPDLRALRSDFDVLGASQNSSLSVINGAATSSLTVSIQLRPRHVGTLQIPALSMAGSRTGALQLQVVAANPSAAAAAHGAAFVEARLEPDHGYVGQQLSFVVRLYFAPDISASSLDLSQVRDLEINQIGNDLNYDAERDGQSYHVVERRYALVAQQPGRFATPVPVFTGAQENPNGPFFGSATPVSASAPAQPLEIRPAPADWGTSAWLPARQLTLSLDGWPNPAEPPRVGQPINLTMTLQATGLSSEVLPALSLPALDGATVYPDKPVTGNQHDDQWIVGRRQQAFAVVPERAGTLRMPPITVKWWNVSTDRMEVAQIPAHSVAVLPAAGGASTPMPAGPVAPAAASSATAHAAASRVVPWRWIALGTLVLGLLGVLLWSLRRRGRPAPRTERPAPASVHALKQAFLAVARHGNVNAQAHHLLAWARAERPAMQHLGQLAAALSDDEQRAAIALLQQRRYAAAATGSDDALATVFKRGFSWRVTGAPGEGPDLPPLYPFKLH